MLLHAVLALLTFVEFWSGVQDIIKLTTLFQLLSRLPLLSCRIPLNPIALEIIFTSDISFHKKNVNDIKAILLKSKNHTGHYQKMLNSVVAFVPIDTIRIGPLFKLIN